MGLEPGRKRMMLGKKGIIFTILAILIAVFLTVMFSAKLEEPLDSRTELVKTRVGLLNNYVEDFFSYTEDVGSISGYAALQSVIEDIRANNKFNPLFEEQFVYCVQTGNLTTTKICPDMGNKNLTRYLRNYRKLAASELHITSTSTINSISVNQTVDPFAIELFMNVTLRVTDSFANITDTRVVQSIIWLDGITDPLYLLNGTYNQTIKRTTLKKKGGDWNETDLTWLYNNHEYRAYTNGSSFIDRIKGNLTSSFFGIESLVNHTAAGVSYTANDTMVDYLFWNRKRFSCKDEIVNVTQNIISPDGFQIDTYHRLSFGISGANTTYTC